MDAREVMQYRLGGGAWKVYQELALQHRELLRQAESEAESSPGWPAFVATLETLRQLSADYDFSHEFGAVGGHVLLKKLLSLEQQSLPAAVEDAVEDIVGAIAQSGVVFPSKAVVTADPHEVIVVPTVHSFADTDGGFDVYLRKVPKPMHGVGQRAVGYVLWNSAVVLARFLVHNRGLVDSRSVLEAGAGLGLCGLVAARYAREVCLSDFTEELLANLHVNVGINRGAAIDGRAAAVAPRCVVCEVRHLDFSTLPDEAPPMATAPSSSSSSSSSSTSAAAATAGPPPSSTSSTCSDGGTDSDGKMWRADRPTQFRSVEVGRRYDVVVGSDTVYCQEDAEGVARVALHHLADDGVLLLVVPQPQHRYGTEHQVPALVAAGFDVCWRPLAAAECTSPAVKGVARAWAASAPSPLLLAAAEALIIDDELLVAGLEEREYVAWLLIVARRNQNQQPCTL